MHCLENVNLLSADDMHKLRKHLEFANNVLSVVANDSDCPERKYIGDISVETMEREYTLSDGTVSTVKTAEVFTTNSETDCCRMYLFAVNLASNTLYGYSTLFSTYMAHYIKHQC